MTGHRCIRLAMGLFVGLFSGAASAPARDIERVMEIGGFQRTYTIFIPDRLQPDHGPFPTVLVLHGGLGTGKIIRRQMRMDPVAEREGFVVVYPDGLGLGWNDGRADRLRQRGAFGRADDVAFLRAVVDTLIEERVALRSEVFLTGVSNGGMMSLRMGCEAADLFAGIAPIIASIPADIAPLCAPSRPMPLLLINATADPLVPWEGGGVGFAGQRGQVVSTMETIAFWLHVNGCAPQEADVARPRGASDNGIGASAKSFKDCRSGAPVVLVSIEGGGHRIPGREERPHPVVDWFLGRQSHDFDTAEAVWQFFARRNPR